MPGFDHWGESGPTDAQIVATRLLAGPQRHTCLVGGARSGKTTTIVRSIIMRALHYPKSRHAILRFRAVHADASIGLDTFPKVMSLMYAGVPYRHVKHPHNLIRFHNGSEIWIGGLDDDKRVDKILGNEYLTIFLNECSQISYPSAKLVRSRLAQVIPSAKQRLYYDLNPVGKSHWTNELFGIHRDPDSRQPLIDPENYCRMFMSPKDNAKYLDAAYLAELESSSGNYRKRFWDGEYVDEVVGALWSYLMLEAARCGPEDEPEYIATVVAIDPSGASSPGDKTDVEMKPQNDEIGIVVASLGVDQKVYLRADLSLVGGPEEWGKAAIAAYHHFKADHILAETNFGGDMVAYVIRSIDGGVPVKKATASSGKHIRAEPVSTLYSKDEVRHVTTRPDQYAALEDQLCAFTTLGYGGPRSPDRADAWIWAVTDLKLQGGAAGWLEYYRRLAEAEGIKLDADPEFGFEIGPAAKRECKVLVPEGTSHVYLSDGSAVLVPADRIITVPEEDAKALGRRGWQRLD